MMPSTTPVSDLYCRVRRSNKTRVPFCPERLGHGPSVRNEKRDEAIQLPDIKDFGKHHLLKRDGDDVVIFGLKSAVMTMASTKLIHADGTFKCVLPGFSQLYIFHAVVENNVSLPMLFCLVKGKTREAFTKLITMVEDIALENRTAIFGRPVTVMCDFETSFIVAVQSLYGSVRVKCFFHIVKNVRKNGGPIVNSIKTAAG